MLAPENRLRTKDFERVKKEGKLLQSENFGVIYINKKDDLPSRYGFVVSTKIAKEAVHRNRIKRALREAVRHNLSILKNGHEVIFLTKRNIIRRTTDEIMKQVREALERVKKR